MQTKPFFSEKFMRQGMAISPMPLFHTCDAYYFKSILKAKKISKSDCPVFKEQLAYLFYGRPAYKSSVKENSQLKSLLPVTFILNYNKVGDYKRVFPFDTGAFEKGLYSEYLHPGMTIDEFQMKPELDSLLNSVDYFYGENVKYFDNKAKKEITYGALDFPIESYHNLILDGGRDKKDDRKASFEIQLDNDIQLNNETLLGVILPNIFEDSDEVRDFLIGELDTNILKYKSYGVASDLHYTSVLDKARDFLIEKGFCNE